MNSFLKLNLPCGLSPSGQWSIRYSYTTTPSNVYTLSVHVPSKCVNGINQTVLSLVNYTHSHSYQTHSHTHTVIREWTTCATISIPYIPQACGDWELCIIVHNNHWFLKSMAFGLASSIIRCGYNLADWSTYLANNSLNSSITPNFDNE